MTGNKATAMVIFSGLTGVMFGAYLSWIVTTDQVELTTQAVIWTAIMLLSVGIVIVMLAEDERTQK
jgi:uncharacterized membrane protein